jgi:hypothetical protein
MVDFEIKTVHPFHPFRRCPAHLCLRGHRAPPCPYSPSPRAPRQTAAATSDANPRSSAMTPQVSSTVLPSPTATPPRSVSRRPSKRETGKHNHSASGTHPQPRCECFSCAQPWVSWSHGANTKEKTTGGHSCIRACACVRTRACARVCGGMRGRGGGCCMWVQGQTGTIELGEFSLCVVCSHPRSPYL